MGNINSFKKGLEQLIKDIKENYKMPHIFLDTSFIYSPINFYTVNPGTIMLDNYSRLVKGVRLHKEFLSQIEILKNSYPIYVVPGVQREVETLIKSRRETIKRTKQLKRLLNQDESRKAKKVYQRRKVGVLRSIKKIGINSVFNKTLELIKELTIDIKTVNVPPTLDEIVEEFNRYVKPPAKPLSQVDREIVRYVVAFALEDKEVILLSRDSGISIFLNVLKECDGFRDLCIYTKVLTLEGDLYSI